MINLSHYGQLMEELKESLTPEIELIESRVVSPTKDFQTIIKAIRKNITKRDHKLIDFDRHNNTYSKLRDKQAVGKLFVELGPRFRERPGGYLRILKCGYRAGDQAPMAYVQLLDQPDMESAED